MNPMTRLAVSTVVFAVVLGASPAAFPTEAVTAGPISAAGDSSPAAAQTGNDELIAFQLNGDIYTMQIDGSRLRQITSTPEEEWHPAWSPDGARLVFQCMTKDGHSNVCLVNADGSGYTQITQWGAEQGAQRPDWSPDGQRIVVSSERRGGTAAHAIVVIDVDGANEAVVAAGRDPSWAPDGSRIVFMRDLQVWTVLTDGSQEWRLTQDEHSYMYPTCSPDGLWIAFDFDHSAVGVMDADGGPPKIVALKSSWNLTWSPDSSRLVIAPSGEGLWLVDVESGVLSQIAGVGTQPAWRPAPMPEPPAASPDAVDAL